MSDLVMWFYGLILLMIKQPNSVRTINWELKIFDNTVSDMDHQSALYQDALRMAEELALCKRRRRSRRTMYNASDIDEVYGAYYINRSKETLSKAWEMFRTGRYRTEGCV